MRFNQSILREISPGWRDWCWSWNSNTLATWCEELKGKDPDVGKDWGQEEKRTTEDNMVGWHHRLDRHGFVWTLGVGDGQGSLACYGSWGRKELDMTEQLNWTEYSIVYIYHSFFIHSSINGHLGCFHVLVIVNSASMNIGVHVSFSTLVSSGYIPSSGIAWSYGGFILSFYGIFVLSSIVAISMYIAVNSARGFPLLHTLSSINCL